MERRLAILQKRSRPTSSEHESQLNTPVNSALTPKLHASRAETLANSERHTRSRSSSVDLSRSHSRPSSHSGTPVPQEDSLNNLKKTAKRRLKGDLDCTQDTKKAKRMPTEVRTAFEYCGLNLPVPTDPRNSVSAMLNHNEKSGNTYNDISITGM